MCAILKKETPVKEWVLDTERQIPRWTSRNSQEWGALIKETVWWLRGVSETPKGKKKLTIGMLKSTNCAPALSKLDFLHGHQIQPRSSWPLQNSRTLFSFRMKVVIKVMNLFFHPQITGVPVMDWKFIGEFSCPPITANYITDTWLKHERMNDRTSWYLIIS